MAIGSNETISFNLDNVTDNQILVYDASTGSFKNETSAVSANANVTCLLYTSDAADDMQCRSRWSPYH